MQSHSIFHQAGKARCRTPWAEMAGSERVRICPHCNTNVYRLFDLSESEVSQLIADSEPASPPLGKKLWLRKDGTFMARQAVCMPDYEQFGRWYIASIGMVCFATLLLAAMIGKQQFHVILVLCLALVLTSGSMFLLGARLFGEDGAVHLQRDRPGSIDGKGLHLSKWISPGFWQLPAAHREALASKIYCMLLLAINSGICLGFYSLLHRAQRVFIIPLVIFGTWMLAIHMWRWFMAQHDACCGGREETKKQITQQQ